MQKETFVTIMLLVMLICVLSCCAGPRVIAQLWEDGVQNAANRVNSESTLNGLAYYITSEIQVGMSRNETETILKTIAPLKVIPQHSLQDVGSGYGPTSCDEIRLKITSFPGHTWSIIACYNAQNELVILRSLDTENFPPLDIYAPIDMDGALFGPF